MVILLFNLLQVIHTINRGVLARDIIEYVYTEPGGNVTLNCSNNGGITEWTFIQRHRDIWSLTISINKQIRPTPPEFRYHYEVTDGETYNLQIVNATNFTEGRYRCLANTDFNRYFYLLLKVPPSELRVINMTERNTIIGKENENLTLACYTLGGIPRGKTNWYHGKKKLTMNKDDNETAYYSLMLNRNHNEQIYTCIAEHDMLKTPLEQSIKLNILYHPCVQCLWPKGPVSVGHRINLSCSYYSNPLDAEILWTKNGQNIDYIHSIVTIIAVENYRKSTEIDLMTTNANGVTDIIIANVTKADAGAYTCNVTNTEGSASETGNLVLQDKDSETDSHSKPPFSGTSVTDVVRQTSFEIEMREITSTEHDESDSVSNQQSLTNQEDTLVDDRHSNLSTTHSQSSSSLSNRLQNMNEADYLHPYHSLVHNSMDVHEYAIVDRNESAEYEEIADVSKN